MSRHASTRRLGHFAKSLRLESLEDRRLLSTTPAPNLVFDTINFEEQFDQAGIAPTPPDPHGAAGPTHVVDVVNVSIEWHTKTGITENSESFRDFLTRFSTSVLPIDGSILSDPKVVYDQYADRFVVEILEIVFSGAPVDPGNISRIWLAVSEDSDPNSDWHVVRINSKETIPPFGTPTNDIFFDYPGFAVDEEAIYVTGNMFTFPTTDGTSAFVAPRLYIIGKTQGSGGGLYNGGVSSVTRHDPSAEIGFGEPVFNFTLQPAHTYGNAPAGVGTFFVAVELSFALFDPNESLGIYRLDNPLTNPTFTRQILDVGDIHDEISFELFTGAPQLGSFDTIDMNDGRVLEAVWRDDTLWAVNTVVPKNGPDAGQTTVHWYKIDTSDLSHLMLADQGNVGGEDIAPSTYTGQGSIAVNAAGDLAIGFAATGHAIHPGAYYAIRKASDPAGTVRSSAVLAEGDAIYELGFRWGDYTGIAVDPEDDATFWVFNEYSTPASDGFIIPGLGIWATRFGRFNINGINNVAPVANDDEATTDMDTAVLIDVVANDTDVNIPVGDQILANTVTIVTPAAHGATIVNPINGEVTYTPAAGFFGTDTFQYTVDDFFGATSNAATVTVHVTDTRPTALDDTDSTALNTLVTIDVIANDFDFSGGTIDPTTVMVMTDVSHGATFVNLVTGGVMYQPNGGFTGGDSFTYRVRDDEGNLSNEATVYIRVGDPVTFAGTVYADINNDGVKNSNEIGIEHVPVTILNDDVGFSITVFTDADGNYALAESPGNDFVLPGGSYTIIETQPIPYHDGIDTAGTPGPTSTANDQFNGVIAAEGTAVTGYRFGERGLRAEFFDAYLNGTLYMMYSSPGVYGWSGLNPAAAPIWVAFNDGTDGEATFGASFGGGSVELGIYDANLNLITSASSASGLTQVDHNAATGAPYLLKVSGTASAVDLDINVPDVDPAEGGSNSPPVFNPIADQTVDVGTVVTFQVTATDPEGDNVRYFLDVSAPPGAAINPTTGWFTWATDEDAPATADFMVLAIDDGDPEQIAQTSFQINVNQSPGGQDTPLAISGPSSGAPGEPQSFTFTLGDPLPGTYLFVIDWDGDGGFDEAQAGTSGLSVDHVFADAGSYTVRVSAVDPLGNWSEEVSHPITINEPTIELVSVVDVYVAGSDWSPIALEEFESAGMGTGGYSIMPDTGEEIQTLAYGGIDKIKVVFSDDAAVSEADLQLAGVNVANYAFEPGGFSYDPATHTAVWTLAAPIGVDKLALRVGGAADEFQLRFNVAPGDATGDGRVDMADFTIWADSFQATGVQAADFVVDGVVTIADFTFWADYANMELPSDEPTMPGGSVVSGGGGGGGGMESVDAAFADWETYGIAADDEPASKLAAETSAAVIANDEGALQPAAGELGWIMMCIYDKAIESGEEDVIGAAN